jgi:ACS family hexuronate transporter-like MFS transporter
VAWLALHFSWRVAFMVASSTGFLWIFAWRFVYPKSLDEDRSPAATAQRPAVASLRELLAHRQTWGLILLRSLAGPLSHFYWFWLPEYLSSARGLSLAQLGRVVWIPYLCGGIGNVFSGALSGQLQKHGRSLDLLSARADQHESEEQYPRGEGVCGPHGRSHLSPPECSPAALVYRQLS